MQLRRCAPILILFFCSLVASCGKSSTSDAPKEGPAGQVQEVEGLVKATRAGQATRTLSAGDTIYVDDSLESGDGASAVILFGHNNATWQLSAGYTGKVVDSLPWRTKRHETSALVRAEHTQTAAAGRNSEREAAESIETMQPSAVMRVEEGEGEGEFNRRGSKTIDDPVATVKPLKRKGNHRPRASSKPDSPSPPSSGPVSRRPGTVSKGLTESARLLGSDEAGGTARAGKAGYRPSSEKGQKKNGSRDNAVGKQGEEATPVVATAAASPKKSNEDDKVDKKPSSQIAKADTSTGAEVSRRQFLELVRASGKACRSHGDGKVSIHLVVENSQRKKLEVNGPAHLGKIVKCMKSKLRKQRNKGSFSVRTSVTFASQ